MKLLLYRNLWGVVEPWEESFPRMKGAGYQGIELTLPDHDDQHRLRERLQQFEFDYICQIPTKGATIEEHLNSFKRQMIEAKNLRPRLVVCLVGSDRWTDNEADRFFREALKIEEAVGVPVAHATVRSRALFHPWRTSRILDQNPNLKLCCDFSQWVVVTERLMEDLDDLLRKCAERCLHVHGRVGSENGPQAADPRAFEHVKGVAAFEKWWAWIWESQMARKLDFTTFTPNYGPPPYLQTLPHTNLPVANVSEICDWQANRARERFAKTYGNGTAP